MEQAGLRTKAARCTSKYLGFTSLAAGILLLSIFGAYQIYGLVSKSHMDRLNVETGRPVVLESSEVEWPSEYPARDADDRTNQSPSLELNKGNERMSSNPEAEFAQAIFKQQVRSSSPLDDLSDKESKNFDQQADMDNSPTSNSFPSINDKEFSNGSIDPSEYIPYLGVTVDPKFWVDLRSMGPPDARIEASKVEASTYSRPNWTELEPDDSQALRIRVSAINVDSNVKDLEIVYLGDSREWETPNNVVGRIPTTAKPGEQGQGWYFGHLESPIKGEGNVFRKLPEIAELLRDGESVFVFIETSYYKYAYQVYKSEVIPQEELRLSDSGEQEITLVACYPRLVYDHRILVTAALVGVQEL